jgi:hypothetical protein
MGDNSCGQVRRYTVTFAKPQSVRLIADAFGRTRSVGGTSGCDYPVGRDDLINLLIKLAGTAAMRESQRSQRRDDQAGQQQ